jgi:WhiB family redox-sensing transcriptional regulator
VDAFSELIRWVEPVWMRDAACRDHPALSWFPEGNPKRPREVVEVCARCSVRAECLDYALALRYSDDLDGIWAGTTVNQRRLLRQAQQRAA